MCNAWCLEFAQLVFPHILNKGKVLEVGSFDINGTTRELLSAIASKYVGVDISAGPGVDNVLDVKDLVNEYGLESFDIVTSTEMLEHCRNWQDALFQMAAVLRVGGVLLITTRSPGFELHDYPADYWRFTTSDFKEIFSPIGHILALDSDLTLGWPCGVGIILRKTASQEELEVWLCKIKNKAVYAMAEEDHSADLFNKVNSTNMIFDQYSRYKACSDLLRQAGFASGNTIVDIGSGPECLFGKFVGERDVTYIDPLISSQSDGRHICGDVFSKELDGRQFSFVTAVDVYEHVPPAFRQAFLERLSSLAANGLVLAFPCSDRGDALGTDRAIADVYRQAYGREYSWLDEHFNYSLPNLEAVLKQLGALGWHCQVIKHGHAPWLRELLGFTVCAWDVPEAHDVVLRISERFNRELYEFDFNTPEYRQFIVATRAPMDLAVSTFSRAMTAEAQDKFKTLMADAWNGLLPVLAQVSKARDDTIEKQLDTQRQLMEFSEWGQRLQAKVEELSSWGQGLQTRLEDADRLFINKQAELMKMSDWAHGMMLELNRLNNTWWVRTIIRFPERAMVGIRRRLSSSIIGSFVRHARNQKKCRQNHADFEALRQSVVDNKGKLIITFPIITWNFRWQRPQHIVTRLRDKGFAVLYLAMSIAPKGRRYHSVKEAESNVRFDTLDNHIHQIWLHSEKQLNIYTDKVAGDDLFNISAGLCVALQKTSAKEIYYLIHFPGWSGVAFDLQRQFGGKIIFDCMDDHGGFSTNTAEALKNEEVLIEQANLVITSSLLLEEKAKVFNPNTILVKNGTEFRHFSQPKPNGELAHLAVKPIVGYYGAISDWFDLEIIQYCAQQRPDWNFVLIGATTGCDTGPVKHLKNVHLLGEKPYKTLPGYLAYFDVCTIPFKIIPLTLATNPVKFYEYLSSGKPVVSVDLPELLPYQDNCYLARNKIEFLEKIQLAIVEKDDAELIERRIELARQNSWDSRVETIISHPVFKHPSI